MTIPAFLLVMSILVLVYMCFFLLGFALYLRWQTEKQNRLILKMTPLWVDRISSWLNQGVLKAAEDEPALFLQFLSRESEYFSLEEKKKLGRLIEEMGLLGYIHQSILSKDKVNRAWAIHLAGLFGLSKFKGDIAKSLDSSTYLVAYSATLAMARLVNPTEPMYKELLFKIVANYEKWTTVKMGEFLIPMGPDAAKELLSLVEKGQIKGRMLWFVIDLAGELELREAYPILVSLLDQDRETVVHAVRSLGLIGCPEAIEPILGLLNHPDWMIRAQAAKVLGYYNDLSVYKSLQNALKDSNWWVRHNAAQSLAAYGQEGREALSQIACTTLDLHAKDMAKFMLEKWG